jgi:hypothetical protein
MDNSEITVAFLRGSGRWTGCCWETRFGSANLNLKGLKSSQAALMAGATSGDERTNWLAATRWLDQVEKDARDAEKQAQLAVDLARLGQTDRALAHAERACQLEAQYTTDETWRPLFGAITKQVASVRHNGRRHDSADDESTGKP